MVHPVKQGKRTRMSFARIEEALSVPDLIEIQKNSYQRFLKEDLREVLADVSPITDYSNSLILEFVDYSLDSQPKNSMAKCRECDLTYAAPLRVTVRLTNTETHEIKESEVFMGDFPIMTENGTFLINGAERVIVSQLVRSPGVYFAKTIDKSGASLYSCTVIPNRGAWIEYETDSNNVLYARLDRARKLPITVLLRALGFESDAQLVEMFGNDERISATIARDSVTDKDGDIVIYKTVSQSESAGYGDKIGSADYAAGISGNLTDLSDESVMVSGATVTSEAVKLAKNDIKAAFDAVKEGF